MWIGGGGIGFSVKVKLKLPTAAKVIQSVGLGADGDIQRFHTQNVLSRIRKYMPFKTGVTSNNLTQIKNPTTIETAGPYAAYLYYGNLMVDDETGSAWSKKYGTKHVVVPHVKLKFNQEKTDGTATRGPKWDKALEANEESALVADLQGYIDYKKRGGK